MRRRREEQTIVQGGDQILIKNGGGAGWWLVKAARYKTSDPYNDKIDMVLSRGSFSFKTEFNKRTMDHRSATPPARLSRDVRKMKPIRFKPGK